MPGFFNYAVKVNRLDLAEEFANDAERMRDSLLDRLDVEKFRRGDLEAIKSYPRRELDLRKSLQLANAYVDAGDYESAERYVTDIVISEENDPRAVTAITFREIANRYRANGDLKNAKRYIDKAVSVGGSLFYQGFHSVITRVFRGFV